MGSGSPSNPGNISHGEPTSQKTILEISAHATQSNSESLPSQALSSYCTLLRLGHDQSMGWIQAPAFKTRLREYQARTRKTQAQVAEDLGTTYGTLRFWLSGTRPPKRENMTIAAELFGCSITEFWDDPGAQIPGLDPGAAATLTAAKRAVINMTFQRLRREDVTDEDALEYYKDLMYLVERGKVRKPRWE